jgi:DNA-binding NarL/FixJ family response regulator
MVELRPAVHAMQHLVRRRVVVVDDHSALRERIVAMLARTCEIVGTAGDGAPALLVIATSKPDVAVLDVALPDVSGLELGALLRRHDANLRLVLYSAHDDEDVRSTVAGLTRSVFVLKGRVNELVAAVNN